MSELDRQVETYGTVAGAKIYHMLKSRAAYKGVGTRRRRRIAAITGVPVRSPRRRDAVQRLLPMLGGSLSLSGPCTQGPPQGDELADVVGVVVGDEQGLA